MDTRRILFCGSKTPGPLTDFEYVSQAVDVPTTLQTALAQAPGRPA